MSNNKIYFENLDSLRTIACLSVFLSHSSTGTTLNKIFDNDFFHRFIDFLINGPNGVSFFFVLSGFLITYLIINENEKKGSFNIKHFYMRRVLRIWPLYYFVLFFGFFVYPFLKSLVGMYSVIPDDIWYHLSFLKNFDSIKIHQASETLRSPMMLGVSWSVAIEEQFYLVWPLAFFLFPKRQFALIPIATIIGCLVFRVLNSDGYVRYYHTLAVMGDLGIGGFFAYFSFQSPKFVEFWRKLPKYVIIIGYIVGVLVLMYLGFVNQVFGPFARLLKTLFFTFIILEQNYSENSLLKYSKIRPFKAFGKYTYSMYMLHPIGVQVSVVLYKILKWNLEDSFGKGVLYAFIALILSLIISYLSFTFYETPFLKLKKKFY